MPKRELDCQLSVGRQHGVSIAEPINDIGVMTLDVTDKASGVQFLSIEIDLADFSLALTGMGMRPAKMKVRALELVGCRRETKTEDISVPDAYNANRDEVGRKAVAPFERDGWTGCLSDTHNHHRISQDSKIARKKNHTVRKVSFVRYVDRDGNPVETDEEE